MAIGKTARLATVLGFAVAYGDDWPQWRGPTVADGRVQVTDRRQRPGLCEPEDVRPERQAARLRGPVR